MSNLKLFLKDNKKVRSNVNYVATKYLTDEEGNPLEWVIRPLSSKESDAIRDECLKVKQVGKQIKQELDRSKYMAKLIVQSVVEPNLNDKELQDSYGVMCAEDLIQEMVDEPGEYTKLFEFITQINGFDETLNDKVDEAKN